MVQVIFPAIWFPAFKLTRGQLLDVNLLGVGIAIPPWNITFWEAVQLTSERVLFDTDAIAGVIIGAINALPQAIWGWAQNWIQSQIDEYYKVHPERKPK